MMKDIRIFIASSKELLPERNALAYLVLAHEDEFAKRGFRVRLSKWEYVDPTMTEERTEDRYLEEMFDCDGALILFRSVLGKYTEEEREKALAAEKAGTSRLKAHRILFKEGDGIVPCEALSAWRSSLTANEFGVFSDCEGLKAEFLALVDRLAACQLAEVSADAGLREITAFLAADEGLEEERNAFADIVLNLNDLLARRRMRVRLRFYDPSQEKDIVAASEMGLVLYQTSFRVFGREKMRSAYDQMKGGANPRRLYVFFRDAEGQATSPEFEAFRNEFIEKLGHFVCQFSGVDTLRLSFLLSLERYAGESVEIYSTVEAPTTSNFVGREDELRKLHGFFAAYGGRFPCGRIPIITGAGGQGKSELVRQYASQFRVEYPGGVFQVNMEHARTWDDVFVGLLKVPSNNGVRVCDYLKIEGRKDKDGRPQPPSAAEVREALLKRARESGAMLVFLDNVEDCAALFGKDGGPAKAFPAGFSERGRVNVVATARVCDTSLRPTDWAVELPLGELSAADALKLLLKNQPATSKEERKAAAGVARLLGYRALYLQRVPALVGDLYAEIMCDTYVDLEKELKGNLLETVAAAADESHLPAVLWKITCERLRKIPLGEQCIKLAQCASFFSGDGFPQHVLRRLWDDVIVKDTPELSKRFDRVLKILVRNNVLQTIEPVKMHRLDIAAVRSDAVSSSLGDAVGESLASYKGMEPSLWLLTAETMSVVRHIPEAVLKLRFPCFDEMMRQWDYLHGHLLAVELVCKNAKTAELCPWETLDSADWADLLSKEPAFADRCPWDKLDDIAWMRLLAMQPQFADKCPWDECNDDGDPDDIAGAMTESYHSEAWPYLISKQPQFFAKCGRVDRFEGSDWVRILSTQPQLADRCDWRLLKAMDWWRLLKVQPAFSEKCNWAAMDQWMIVSLYRDNDLFKDVFERYVSLVTLTGKDWADLLEVRPCFADRCEWEKLDGYDWSNLLKVRPELCAHCDWSKLDGYCWQHLLRVHPQFAEHCNWDCLDGLDWCALLGGRTGEGVAGEGSNEDEPPQPQFAKYCQWWKLEPWQWADLLSEQPQYVDECTCWSDFGEQEWASLLEKQPQFEQYKAGAEAAANVIL